VISLVHIEHQPDGEMKVLHAEVCVAAVPPGNGMSVF